MTQLDPHALKLLEAGVSRHGSIAKAARHLGLSRTAISLARVGKYPGDTARVRARILEAFAVPVVCPHLDVEIEVDTCRDHRTRTLPVGDPPAILHWRACQACPHNPKARTTKEKTYA